MDVPGSSAVPRTPSGPGSGLVIGMLYELYGRKLFAMRYDWVREYTPLARTAKFAINSRSIEMDASSLIGSFSFGLATRFDPAACDTKSGPFGSRFTSPGSYALLPFTSCQR